MLKILAIPVLLVAALVPGSSQEHDSRSLGATSSAIGILISINRTAGRIEFAAVRRRIDRSIYA